MFDIGFSELVLVGIVALIVLGPERLPVAARMAGLWLGRFKRGFTSIREEVEREIGADEIRRQLHNEDILAKERKMLGETVEKTRESLQQSSKAFEESVLDAQKVFKGDLSAILSDKPKQPDGTAQELQPANQPEMKPAEIAADAEQGKDEARN